jgi:hypothetical protein
VRSKRTTAALQRKGVFDTERDEWQWLPSLIYEIFVKKMGWMIAKGLLIVG